MKTKKEIEQLAQEIHYEFQNQGLDANGCFNQYQGYIKGYSQCQEDMNKRIIELENTLHTICTWCNPHDSSHENIWRLANSLLTK